MLTHMHVVIKNAHFARYSCFLVSQPNISQKVSVKFRFARICIDKVNPGLA